MLNELINRINIYTPMIGRNRIGKEKIIQFAQKLCNVRPHKQQQAPRMGSLFYTVAFSFCGARAM